MKREVKEEEEESSQRMKMRRLSCNYAMSKAGVIASTDGHRLERRQIRMEAKTRAAAATKFVSLSLRLREFVYVSLGK